MRGVRIVRVPVYHRTVFEGVVRAALRSRVHVRLRGAEWEVVEKRRGVAIYRRVGSALAWVQQGIEDYEFAVYSELMVGHCSRDGHLRRRTRLGLGSTGAHRPAVQAAQSRASSSGGPAD